MKRKRQNRAQIPTSLEKVPGRVLGFESSDEVIQSAVSMLKSRQDSDGADSELVETAKDWKRYWHRSIHLSSKDIPLCSHFQKARLNHLEREILIVLVLEQLGMVNNYISDAEDVLKYLLLPPKEMLEGMRLISEESRLYKSKLIDYKDTDEPLASRTLLVDPSVLDDVLNRNLSSNRIWPVKSQSELFDYMRRLSFSLQKKCDAMDRCSWRHNSNEETYMYSRKTESALRALNSTLKAHPDWPLATIRKKIGIQGFDAPWIIFLALLGKELGHIPVDDDLFKGSGLIRASSVDKEYETNNLAFLEAKYKLRKNDWIQPCGGNDSLISDDSTDLEDSEFELTEKSTRILQLKPKSIHKRNGNTELREPKTRLSDLVYTHEIRESLSLALTQSRNANVLFEKWGLGEKIPYGRGVTALFSGPPGTGKTASAEALAGELGKPLLVANYAKIQNCLVGQTEKNIVSTFREAKQKDAVLLWDEADAMFFDRDSADRNWEVRDVNVLLQEIERFEGICVLTTNRKVYLDKALERRISLKIEFAPPDRKGREAIFRKLIPNKLPLGKDIDFAELSMNELSGGEIKNVILNAARIALHLKGSRGKVSMEDFKQAIENSRAGMWGINNERGKIGFCKSS